MSCGFLRDKPSMEETLRPLLWEDASSVCGSNLHVCTQNKLNVKIKSGNAKKWICSVEIFFFFNRIKYRPSFYNFQELQTHNSPVLFSICTQHERAGSPVTKVNSWPQQKTVFSDIMSVWNKPIMQTRSRVVIMEPCDGDLKLWKFPRTFQTGLCRRGKSNRPCFLNPSWWQLATHLRAASERAITKHWTVPLSPRVSEQRFIGQTDAYQRPSSYLNIATSLCFFFSTERNVSLPGNFLK